MSNRTETYAQWSAKTFEDFHKPQSLKSSSTLHHGYNRSDRS
ncbi:hypothetical protein [uncultured Nostoc sp.]